MKSQRAIGQELAKALESRRMKTSPSPNHQQESEMSEPCYVRQNGDVPLDMHKRSRWYTECQMEAMREYGCTFFRFSYHPDNPELCLVEGWTEFEAKQGEPRFSLELINADLYRDTGE